jgi:RHS repeat-associated protein
VWDGDKLLHEWSELEVGPDAGSVDELTTWLFEEDSFVPAAKLTKQGAYSVVTDHLGTPLELYDQRGTKTWQAQLDSYGAVREGKGKPQDCPFRYQGQYEDVETGLYYNRFRYYDPEAGQYISQDPIGLDGGMLLYGYVSNTASWVDILGLSCSKIVEELPELHGKSVAHIERILKKNGFTNQNPANPKNNRWSHVDGSEVSIHKYGNTNTTPYKSGNNAHVHKSIGRHGHPNSTELNDAGLPSSNPNETHIGIKNPADYPLISGRPHGS